MKATVLGDPDHEALRDLRALTDEVYFEERLLGSYITCVGTKSAQGAGSAPTRPLTTG